MVKTRSQTAKADTEKTKRARSGGGGGSGGDNGKGDGGGANDIDEVTFREFLASVFPSNFARRRAAMAKKRAAMAAMKSEGKRRKVRKIEEDSDASSSASVDESISSDDECKQQEQERQPCKSNKKGKKWHSFTAVDGVLRPVKKEQSTARVMKKHMNTLKRDFKKHVAEDVCEEEYDSEDSSPDYDPNEHENGCDSVSESASNADSDDEEGNNEDLECEDDDIDELLGEDENPEEQSDYDDGEDADGGPMEAQSRGQKAKDGTNIETEATTTELDEVEKEYDDIIDGTPKAFQNKFRGLLKEFKTKLESERKQFVAKGKKLEKKAKRDNLMSFRRMLKEGDVMNDLRYFNRCMSLKEQQAAMDEMERVKSFSRVDKPYRLRLLDAPIPPQIKAVALKKINALRYTSPGDGEYNKLKKWVDAFLQIPFGKNSQLELSLTDGQDKCHNFMEDARKILDQAVYGLDDVKLQVIQMLGQWISNPNAVGSAMAIHGPMGTGKTTLVKDGISKILGREFIFIALGGATDSSFLEGHSYTYEGSTWGKIVDLLMQCQTMNPIIYFDELDKVSDTPRGEEIIGILTHLTDTSQNDKFHDKYFSEIEFDLSKCMFFFSYNDPDKVNPILRDRMYTIKTNGYNSSEKVTIAEKHLIPKLLPQVGFTPEQLTIPKEVLDYIAKEYTSEDEKGVRSLKRRLEIIMTKLNLYRLLKPGTNMFGQKIPESVEFPMTVTEELVRELLKKEKSTDDKHWVMYT